MSLWRYILRSLSFHWRIHFAVALSVAAATAVLTGALLVGDSVRASLRQLTLDRLGRIDHVLLTDRFFREQLAQELSADERYTEVFEPAVPVMLFPAATVEHATRGGTTRATNVLLAGCDESFWQLGDSAVRPQRVPNDGEIILNRPLADDLHAAIGDEVLVRLPKSSDVPADSPLANKSDRIRSLAGLKIIGILPARSLGQFHLRPTQSMPRNAFLSRKTIQQALELDTQINGVLVATKRGVPPEQQASEMAEQVLRQALRPSFEDFGLRIQHVRQDFTGEGQHSPQTIFDYYSLSTDRMIFSQEAERLLEQALASWKAQGVFTYLANSIERSAGSDQQAALRRIPYSMIAAIDPSAAFPLRDLKGQPIAPLASKEIVLNEWAARDLGADIGDTIRVQFFAPETAHGDVQERASAFTLKAITPLTEPAQPYRRNRPAVYKAPPTLANDPALTPEVKGVTDQETIDDWDAPFPFDYSRMRKQDDEFWANHRMTPKAFISLDAGQRLWGSRFGRVTSFRIPAAKQVNEERIQQQVLKQLANHADSLGFAFDPVKRRQLEASQGTTPFDVLFLSLSFFIIAAALLLVALLFNLGMEQRAAELGTVLAVGLRRRRAASLLLVEALAVAAVGGVIGIAIGSGYARLMLYGLRTWWIGAITSPFVHYAPSLRSFLTGYALGVLACLLSIVWALFAARRVPIRRLLAGQMSASTLDYRRSRFARPVALLLFVSAVGALIAAVRLVGMLQAVAFVGGGAALLTGLLLELWSRLKRGGGVSDQCGLSSLFGLAWRNAARKPTRSTMTMGLIAAASFLIVATSSFRLAPTGRGVGGFEFVATSAQPIFVDLNRVETQRDLLGADAEQLAGSQVFSFRMRSGDDASCNNLYQPAQPRVLGVTPQFIQHFGPRKASEAANSVGGNPSGLPAPGFGRPGRESGFAWATTAAQTPEDRDNPWRLLANRTASPDDAIPAIVDMNTAFYSLKPPVSLGSIYTASYGAGKTLRFRIVGLLENSVLQGSLLIAEHDFERCFPEVSGYRYFLIDSPPAAAQRVAEVWEDRLQDEGLDALPATQVLGQLLAVQNAYLSTFQSLGALGLLLGTFGLAAVQLRNVVERRGELALLRANGFRQRRLLQLVLFENVSLLLVGLAVGVAAALIAVLPHKLLGDAAIPLSLLRDMTAMLAGVFLAGSIASFFAARAALRAPILAALREE